MKMKKFFKILFIVLSIALPIIIIVLMAHFELYSIWEKWGLQSDGITFTKPDFLNYLFLILFKFTLYVIPPAFFSISRTIKNKKEIKEKKYLYYLLNSLNYWFLILLVIKLGADSILELDRLFGIKLFDSIKDVQTLIGYIMTVILQRQFKIEPDMIKESNNK